MSPKILGLGSVSAPMKRESAEKQLASYK